MQEKENQNIPYNVNRDSEFFNPFGCIIPVLISVAIIVLTIILW